MESAEREGEEEREDAISINQFERQSRSIVRFIRQSNNQPPSYDIISTIDVEMSIASIQFNYVINAQ